MAPDDEISLGRVVLLAYSDLYAKHQALIAVLERHHVVVAEHFEAEVEEYRVKNAARLYEEAERWWKTLLKSAFPSSGGAPSAD